MSSPLYLYGKNPLKEALLSYQRTGNNPIEKLYLTKSASENPSLISLIQTNKIPYTIVTQAEIESKIDKEKAHQGILALLDDKVLYTKLEDVLVRSHENEKALFVLLDELEDPHNVGAIIRSAVAFGAACVLIPEHNQARLTGTVIKSSAGMNFSIPLVRIGNINTTILSLKEKGFWVYGLTKGGTSSLYETTFDAKTLLIIGNEGDGMSKKTTEHCDFTLSIPISTICESLNASTSAAVVLYEFAKQNHAAHN